jgi:hypothetical protein
MRNATLTVDAATPVADVGPGQALPQRVVGATRGDFMVAWSMIRKSFSKWGALRDAGAESPDGP